MEGILSKINNTVYNYDRLAITEQDIKKWFDEAERASQIALQLKNKRVEDNLRNLKKKAKELNRPIPDELLVVVNLDTMMGSWFFEKYKEWVS